MVLHNDVLSIISIYADIPIYYDKNKLIINTDKKCESCNSRMRRTHKSLVEAYAFPKLWELNQEFNFETGKYIRSENTFIKIKNQFYTYQQAYNNGYINYNNRYTWTPNNPTQLYGGYIIHNVPLTIFVKKAPSLSIFYRTIKDVMGYNTNEDKFLEEMKKFEIDGINEEIMDKVIKRINITNKPRKIVIRLCSKCRDNLKKGYIFT